MGMTDGVNVAARLQGLAETGGICISHTVFDHFKHKIEFGFIELGQQKVKNIEEPILFCPKKHILRIILNGKTNSMSNSRQQVSTL